MAYEWNFGLVLRYSDILVAGFINTLRLGFSALVIAVTLGLVLVILRLSRFWVLRYPVIALVEFLRASPAMVLLFWVYFALPIVIGVTLTPFTAACLTLGVQASAFFSEAYRAGIVSIDKSQWEGGRALGMSSAKLLQRIILPQAVRRMVPPLMERTFELMKATTQASVITYGELLYNSLVLSAQLFRPIEIFSLLAVFFFVFLTTLSMIMRRIEAALQLSRS